MELMMKKVMFLGLLSAGVIASIPAWAANSGMCTATNGAHHSVLPFYGKTITAIQNRAGTTVNYETSNSDRYPGKCECRTGTTGSLSNLYYTAQMSSALTATAKRSGVSYYNLDEYLDVGLSIEIYGRGFVNAPFTDQPNSPPEDYKCNTLAGGITFDSGTKATIYFYINEPFIGTITIPQTLIARLYGTVSSTVAIDESQPLADVYIAGDITAPQECTINGGQVIEVDFSKIPASAFSSTPGAALTDRKVPISVSVSCTGMSSGQDVEVSLHATQVGSLPTVIETTNADVGIKVYDEYNKEVDVNGGRMETDMGTRSRLGVENGEFNFFAAPASATGTRPQPGTFSANATITMEIKN
ncbi:TPA: fimbrial protein [Kluyvera ascorbata]|uniref:fimbrial protein n=1 Tax=Kluyvera sp. CRP TaxID=2873269 RepID=UPI001CC1D0EE|nr:fimbrial protein [Kluyvera sp. CRP]UAK21274.1 fimbrial protein [Kluyvera sp. CRP]HDT6547332.1 fimbrial protein [Kluyvera ascorbata]